MIDSPSYIHKCEMAEEIQAMRAPEAHEEIVNGYKLTYPFEFGDWFSLYYNNKWDVVVYGNTIYRPSIYYRKKIDAELSCDFVGFDEGDPSAEHIEKIAWLPRLDQLLDIATGMEVSMDEALQILDETRREERFLDVIMRNKFGKKWNGENWESLSK